MAAGNGKSAAPRVEMALSAATSRTSISVPEPYHNTTDPNYGSSVECRSCQGCPTTTVWGRAVPRTKGSWTAVTATGTTGSLEENAR